MADMRLTMADASTVTIDEKALGFVLETNYVDARGPVRLDNGVNVHWINPAHVALIASGPA
jgi:hypothetical protein